MQPDFPFPAFVLPGPLNLILTRLMRGMARRHPAILRRLGDKAGARILIDVTDAPFPLLMEPAALRLTAVRRDVACDAVIRGRLEAFLDMLHGGADGDALFFSGALEISGDTAAVLALRNALDDAELDLTDELAAEGGPLAPILRRGAALLARRSGLMLTRHTGGMR